MADEEEQRDEEDSGGEDGGEEGKTGGKKGLIIAVVLGVLLLAGGGGGAYFFLMGGEEDGEETAAEQDSGDAEHAGEEGAATAPSGPVFYEMPEFLVNLNSPNNKPSFLKMKVTLELEKQADIQVVESYMPRITDNLNTYLRELRSSDLSGSAGLYRLREELLMRINQYTAPTKVQNVLFKDIVVQ